MKKAFLLTIVYFITTSNCISQSKEGELTISLTFLENIQPSVINDGRLYLFFSKNQEREPRLQTFPNPLNSNQIFGVNIASLDTNKSIVLDDTLNWKRTSDWTFNNIPSGEYFIQVLWDQDTSESDINAPGNLFSDQQKVNIDGKKEVEVAINQIIPERKIVSHELVKEINYKSDTLSKWWSKSIYVKASILLPPKYNSKKKYPIRYNVAGYGGRYTRVNRLVENTEFMTWWNTDESPEVINVFLDGEGPFGDSYQMDSENSGPYGHALIYELIPHIESKYRGTQSAVTRFVDGCSTGGWVSLGLQLYYPEHFNGVFSYSPDAIEFENYQLTNIYKDKNVYVNEFGYLRPVARFVDGEPFLSMKKFIQFENVLGNSNTYLNSGGQFSAHTALYSPKGNNGLPKPLFDPETGEIDSSVAEYWKKYDFKIYAQQNWAKLGPKLKGKIFIWMGDMDGFYLNMATRKFDEFIRNTENPKSDAKIVFSPTQGHCSKFSHKVVLEQIQEKLELMKNTNE